MSGYRQNNDEPLFSFEIYLSEKYVEIKNQHHQAITMTHSLIKSRTILYRGNCIASVMMCDTAQAGVTPVFI